MSFDEYAAAKLPGLLRFAAVLSGDRQTGEDVVQNVLLRASRRWASIEEAASPDAYVRRMIVNEYISWRRKWARLIPVADVFDDRVEPDFADRHAERQALDSRLDRLPRRQRAVLVLRFYEGLGDDDIARILDCSTGTVRSHASRALAALRIDAADERSLRPAHKKA